MRQLLNGRIVSVIAGALLQVYARTLRLHTLHSERIDTFHRQEKPVIIAFWHGSQLMMPFAYRGKRGAVLVSQHRDGEYIHGVLRHLGFDTVRGSTTRGGSKAFNELIARARAGSDIVVTPDGPRGPRCAAKPGVIYLAQRTGLPILPLAFGAARKKVLRSWDRFELPYPGTLGVFVWGEPLWVVNDPLIDAKCKELEDVLNQLCHEADQYCAS